MDLKKKGISYKLYLLSLCCYKLNKNIFFSLFFILVLSDEENGESNLSTSQYSDDDSILPFSTDSEEEKDYLKSLEQKKISSKFTCVKRKYLKFNHGSKELTVERSLQGRKIAKIGEVWFSHPMYDNRSSPEDSASDDERSVNNKNISHKVCDKRFRL